MNDRDCENGATIKLVDANTIIRVLEADLERMPRDDDYDEGWCAGVAQIIMTLRLMPPLEEQK